MSKELTRRQKSLIAFTTSVLCLLLSYALFCFTHDNYVYTSDECCEIYYVEPWYSIFTLFMVIIFFIGLVGLCQGFLFLFEKKEKEGGDE